MIDWTKSMQQTYEVWTVDPYTWGDVEKIKNVSSASITRDESSQLVQNATIEAEGIFGEMYVRIYIICIQNGETYKESLGTFLVQTPSESYNGNIIKSSMDAYSPLIELRDKYPPIGYTIPKNTNIMDLGGSLIDEQCRAPVIKAVSDKTLSYNFVADKNDTWLSFLSSYIDSAGYKIGLDEQSRIIFLIKQKLSAMRPRFTFDTGNSSILSPNISISRDLYGIPNVVEVYYSRNTGGYSARVVNNNKNSIVSVQNRGREVVKRVLDPKIAGTITQSSVDVYAQMLLEELSIIEYSVKYTHGYYPLRIGDCVRLDHPRLREGGVNALIISQTIKLGTGVTVEETSKYTTNLLGD